MHGAAARKVFADAGIDSTSRMVGLSFCGKRYTAVEMVDAIEAQLKPTGGVGQYQVYIYIYIKTKVNSRTMMGSSNFLGQWRATSC